MKILTQLSALVFALAAVLPSASATDTSKPLTAEMAYEHVQGLRKQSYDLVNKNPSKDSLDQAISLMNSALFYLDERVVQDMAVGNRALFYRGLDARLDLAALYVQTKQYDRALTTLEQINGLFWWPNLQGYLADSKTLAPLEKEPRMQALLRVSKIPQGLYENKALSGSYKPTLTAAEKAAGVSIFWHQVRSDFAFFDHVPDLDWGATYLKFLEKVETTSSTEEYYRVLMQLAPLLRDGHTNIYPPEELSSKFYSRPPLRTELIEGKVIVTRIDNERLKELVSVGDEIVEIDGVPVHTYAETYVNPFVSSSTPQDRAVRLYSYQLLGGDEDKTLKLSLKNRAGVIRETLVSRKGYEKGTSPEKFAFRMLPENIAYISIDHFESDAGVKAFERAFPSILQASGLIIDVRNNGGGSSWHGMRILQFLSNEPIKGLNSYSRGDTGLTRNDHNVVELKPISNGGSSTKRTRPVFSGPVIILTGARTFSAAEDFVAAFKTISRGKVVGNATGGSTGEPILVNLPGGGTGRICAKRDTFADGTTFVGKGLFPDISAEQTLADFYVGRDTVLARALAEMTVLRH
jgi:carboxyl-terminal processing protease